ncbi:amphi-Trp domain-containing protein [Actinoplanes sp. CA-051413]|uniref:amphi-Trp domain-containing protein n=1 Tax=Actinoplanes sp. CA-051413 TaxID=3239899 RepID=UPI003D963ECA
MAGVEIKRKIRISRKEAGARLIELGKALTAAPEAELELDGDSIKFTVADDLAWEFELEVDGNEVELEIELKWSQAPVASPAPDPAPPARRARNSHRGNTG